MGDWSYSREYLDSCWHRYCHERGNFRRSGLDLVNAEKNLQARLESNPDARTFIELQKSFYHNISMQNLKRSGSLSDPLTNAVYFLSQAEPVIEKHRFLKDRLEEWFYKIEDMGVSIKVVLNLIKRERAKPLPVDKLPETLLDRSFLEISLEDIAFIDYYKRKTEIEWQLYSGLLAYEEPSEGKSNNGFYSKISDFMLCMIDGIEILARKIEGARQQRMS